MHHILSVELRWVSNWLVLEGEKHRRFVKKTAFSEIAILQSNSPILGQFSRSPMNQNNNTCSAEDTCQVANNRSTSKRSEKDGGDVSRNRQPREIIGGFDLLSKATFQTRKPRTTWGGYPIGAIPRVRLLPAIDLGLASGFTK